MVDIDSFIDKRLVKHFGVTFARQKVATVNVRPGTMSTQTSLDPVYERNARFSIWRNLIRLLYQEPVFKARCDRVGRRFMARGERIPLVRGHRRLRIGSQCVIPDVTTFVASTFADDPLPEIGGW